MGFNRRLAMPWLIAGVVAALSGCHRGATGASFLSLFGLRERPVVMALVAEPGVLDPFAPYEKLRHAMSETIKRPVRLDLCVPLQLGPNLKLGFYDFALLTPACYVELADRERFEILAVAADQAGRAARSALLVVGADSEIEGVGDLRGKKVAFGPRQDARTHRAALLLLAEHGIGKRDLSLALMPLPGSLKHFSSPRQLARAVQNGDFEAGFIDEAAFDEFDLSPADEDQPNRSKLRIIARTIPVPGNLVIQSPKANPETVRSATDFLLWAGQTHPQALRPLLWSACRKPPKELYTGLERLAKAAATASEDE